MVASTIALPDLVAKLPEASTFILHGVDWKDYEDLLEAVGEAHGLRISYSEGILQAMTLSSEHEKYSNFIQDLVRLCTMRTGRRLASFGSATLKTRGRKKGLEPDVCFYVDPVGSLAFKKNLDFDKDPPPDLAVEIDVHHDSLSKFPIYSTLGVPEIWRYDGKNVFMYRLAGDQYHAISESVVLPNISCEVLMSFILRLENEDENSILLSFEGWLQNRLP
jgi:Uma2 family endonuclease